MRPRCLSSGNTETICFLSCGSIAMTFTMNVVGVTVVSGVDNLLSSVIAGVGRVCLHSGVRVLVQAMDDLHVGELRQIQCPSRDSLVLPIWVGRLHESF